MWSLEMGIPGSCRLVSFLPFEHICTVAKSPGGGAKMKGPIMASSKYYSSCKWHCLLLCRLAAARRSTDCGRGNTRQSDRKPTAARRARDRRCGLRQQINIKSRTADRGVTTGQAAQETPSKL